jgi:hypothetical protein
LAFVAYGRAVPLERLIRELAMDITGDGFQKARTTRAQEILYRISRQGSWRDPVREGMSPVLEDIEAGVV